MNTSRREFIKTVSTAAISVAATACSTIPSNAEPAQSPIKKALQLSMLPKQLSDADKFKMAFDCGFVGIEASPIDNLDAAKKLGDLARNAGTPIHSIVYGWWNAPLTNPDPKELDEQVKRMEHSLHCAKAMGADAVLLVPALVNEKTRYADAYVNSQVQVKKLIPLAHELQVLIAIEFVWNNFLLSPIEFSKYVDEINDPMVQAYFDTGNVVAYGWTEDWIRTLGKRTRKVHLKDFRRKDRAWTNLREGDVNWPEVAKAFTEVGYTGYVTPELSGGDETYLKDLSKRIDLILAGK